MWLIKILLMALFMVFLVQNNNDLVSVWPIPESSLMVGVSVVYLAMFCLGYLYGRMSAWSAYAPLRATLRKQKKANKMLSKEHEKLNHEHEKLNQQISTLQEEADKADRKNGFSLNQKIKGWFSKPSAEDK